MVRSSRLVGAGIEKGQGSMEDEGREGRNPDLRSNGRHDLLFAPGATNLRYATVEVTNLRMKYFNGQVTLDSTDETGLKVRILRSNQHSINRT